MGCTSSTEAIVDPVTGQQRKKKRLGGAYPGQRPSSQTHQPYVPPPEAFDGNGTATVQFATMATGGNALVVVQPDGSARPETGPVEPILLNVTIPQGVKEGDVIHVKSPDGQLNAVVVPGGYGPGSTFTVEFAPPTTSSSSPPPPLKPNSTSNKYQNNGQSTNNFYQAPNASTAAGTQQQGSTTAVPSTPQQTDDFASGFGQRR